MTKTRRWTVTGREVGMRLDSAVASHLTGMSRSRAQRLIADGLITVDGETVRPHRILRAGEKVKVIIPPASPSRATAELIPLSIVYEDRYLVVIDKPPGLVVHPAPGHPSGTLVNALLGRYGAMSGVGGATRPGIVHRLDKDTSGLLVAARTPEAHLSLADQIASRTLKRVYLALVAGVIDPPRGRIDLAIGRHHRDRKRISPATRRPREAVTEYRLIENLGNCSLVQAELRTGRTHQIRVHLAAVGNPVIGDPVYGRRRWRQFLPVDLFPLASRQMLHACRLELSHPVTGEPLCFESPLPSDFQALLDRLRGIVESP